MGLFLFLIILSSSAIPRSTSADGRLHPDLPESISEIVDWRRFNLRPISTCVRPASTRPESRFCMSMKHSIGTPIFNVNRNSDSIYCNNIGMSIGTRIKECRKEAKLTQKQLAEKIGIRQSTLSELENGESAGTTLTATFAKELRVSALWLETGRGEKRSEQNLSVESVFNSNDHKVAEISYFAAKGSCGGGVLNEDAEPKGKLLKEIGFFKKYQVKPQNLIAIYADGDSMANFIIDGDMVLFDITKKDLQSNKIFAIDHPDGLRIKRLRRKINGAWVLESDNPDKQRYPDEEISPTDAEHLKIYGQFVYRQGG